LTYSIGHHNTLLMTAIYRSLLYIHTLIYANISNKEDSCESKIRLQIIGILREPLFVVMF